MSRQYQWLALFYGLVVTQTAHLFEQAAQMIQIHVLGLTGPDARGIFGALDIEWVHFLWNTWVLLAVLVLLARFRTNGWLWLTLLLSAWHELEHAYARHGPAHQSSATPWTTSAAHRASVSCLSSQAAE